MVAEVVQYYENYDEDNRLRRDKAHLVEFLTTVHYFDKLLKPGSHVLDACAGTGIYSFYLAEKGHVVTAADLSKHHVDIMRSHASAGRLQEITTCNVLDMSGFPEESFDVVLCMGALYHLKTNAERERAVMECCRVLKPGGLLVLAYLNTFACIAANVNSGLTNIDEAMDIYNDRSDFVFTTTTPAKMLALTKACRLETLYRVGVDGSVYVIGEKINCASQENFDKWMAYHLATCEEGSILGASMHGLDICQKMHVNR